MSLNVFCYFFYRIFLISRLFGVFRFKTCDVFFILFWVSYLTFLIAIWGRLPVLLMISYFTFFQTTKKDNIPTRITISQEFLFSFRAPSKIQLYLFYLFLLQPNKARNNRKHSNKYNIVLI